MRGERDDWDIAGLWIVLDPSRGFPAIDHGHFEDHQDDIGALADRHSEALLAILGGEHLEIAKKLELLGDFEVLTAEDGEKGCTMALSERPDIILMDLEMPVVDGWEATRRLKGNPQTRDIPIVALSAHALAGEREKALAAGCNEFDTKPIEFDRLVATLRRILADRNDAL